jgi:hypothetical protein
MSERAEEPRSRNEGKAETRIPGAIEVNWNTDVHSWGSEVKTGRVESYRRQ